MENSVVQWLENGSQVESQVNRYLIAEVQLQDLTGGLKPRSAVTNTKIGELLR